MSFFLLQLCHLMSNSGDWRHQPPISWVLPGTVKYCQVLSGIAKYCQVLPSGIFKCCQVLWSTIIRYCQVLSSIAKYCHQVFPSTFRYLKESSIVWCFSMFSLVSWRYYRQLCRPHREVVMIDNGESPLEMQRGHLRWSREPSTHL